MILSQSLLKNAAKEAREKRMYESYSNKQTFRYDSADKYDLFISHSFSDKDLVVGLRYLFAKTGYKVYVDWIDDPTLNRNNVSSSTASIIKNRIKCSKGLAYVSTSNITSSKWCPWELGVADGMYDRACILPVMDSSFKGQEYLGLYPYLDYAKTADDHRDEFWIYDPQDRKKYVILSAWLNGKKPFSRD